MSGYRAVAARQLARVLGHTPRGLHWLAVAETCNHGACAYEPMYAWAELAPLSMHEHDIQDIQRCRIGLVEYCSRVAWAGPNGVGEKLGT